MASKSKMFSEGWLLITGRNNRLIISFNDVKDKICEKNPS